MKQKGRLIASRIKWRRKDREGQGKENDRKEKTEERKIDKREESA